MTSLASAPSRAGIAAPSWRARDGARARFRVGTRARRPVAAKANFDFLREGVRDPAGVAERLRAQGIRGGDLDADMMSTLSNAGVPLDELFDLLIDGGSSSKDYSSSKD